MISNLLAMFHLQISLLQKGSLSPQEKHVLGKCHKRADRSFVVGGSLGGAIAVAATWKLGWRMFRPAIATRVGAVLIAGTYAMERSQRSCLEEILALDGTRLQRELVTIIMQKHQNNASLMQLISRRFYAEDVFDDSGSDSRVRKWRYRNIFIENVYGDSPSGHGSQAEYGDNPHGHGLQAEYGDSPHGHGSQAVTHVSSISDTNDKKASVKSKQLPISNNSDVMDDPLDEILGDTTPAEEIQLLSGTRTPIKESSRSHKRSHRRRRQHQREAAADWDHVQPQRI